MSQPVLNSINVTIHAVVQVYLHIYSLLIFKRVIRLKPFF